MADSISASPQNPALAALARALRFREEAQKGLNSPTGALLDLVLPTSRTVEKWSYGDPLFRMPPPGTGGYVPVPTRDKEYLAESIAYAPVGTAAKVAGAGVPLTAGVIKPKGGNWLAGQVERQVTPLKATTNREEIADLRQQFGNLPAYESSDLRNTNAEAVNKWLDQKLTKYIKNEMASPEDPLRLQADTWAEKQADLLGDKTQQIERALAKIDQLAAQRGVTPEMLTQSRQDLLALQKERDKIAARTGIHFNPARREFGVPQYRVLQEYRQSLGYPVESQAASPTGRSWEDLADYYLQQSPAGDILKENYFLRDVDAKRIYDENQWLYKVPPETKVYSPNRGMTPQDTGFKHMADELRNALNPDSGLPKELLITPKDLEKMNVAQAAELVDKINAHRAILKREADALAAQKSIEVYKEYPDTEKGLRWVEMKLLKPEGLPEGFEVKPLMREGKEYYAVYGPDGKSTGAVGKTPEQAIENQSVGMADLEEALKYEGDVMQHCVGGYCPDVASGASRIFSLRDKTGKPSVTIEVVPEKWFYEADKYPDPTGQYENFHKLIHATRKGDGDYEQVARELAQQYNIPQPQRIEQIKGQGNNRPPSEVMEYVQDFVRSQPWTEVKDTNFADIVPLRSTLLKNAQERGIKVNIIGEFNGSPHITKQEFNRLADEFGGMNKYPVEGKAEGGLVEYDADEIADLAEQIRNNRYAAGGLVEYNPDEIQQLAQQLNEELLNG